MLAASLQYGCSESATGLQQYCNGVAVTLQRVCSGTALGMQWSKDKDSETSVGNPARQRQR
ncbi:hypothetical protein EII33_05605 [Bacteroides heparinolyticus]|uniref:Uncharacterized protein n=1 Tax=Prevotella heparinolytica TaxID=28113 RepID=A0A3P2AAU0_9BACE|nr:hypothetical protein EII33_05605 [Bacteroides heparinolyticus]